MTHDSIISTLKRKGYSNLFSNVINIEFYIRYLPDGNSVKVIGITDSSSQNAPSVEQINAVYNRIQQRFVLVENKNVDTIFIIFSDNIEKDKVYNNNIFNFWLIDKIGDRLIVFENQPDDFDSIKYDILNSDNYSYGNSRNRRARTRAPKSDFVPYVTIMLMGINIFIFIITWLSTIGMSETQKIMFMVDHGASYSSLIFDSGEYYRLFTCMFLHSGISHIFGNMVALFLLGMSAEKLYGRFNYLIMYLVTGLLSSFVSAWIHYGNRIISVGASGAIYGILGGIIILILGQNKDKNSKALNVLIVVIMLVYAGRSGGSMQGSSIDYIAHFSGMVAGMIFGLVQLLLLKMKNDKIKNSAVRF